MDGAEGMVLMFVGLAGGDYCKGCQGWRVRRFEVSARYQGCYHWWRSSFYDEVGMLGHSVLEFTNRCGRLFLLVVPRSSSKSMEVTEHSQIPRGISGSIRTYGTLHEITAVPINKVILRKSVIFLLKILWLTLTY